MKRVVAIISTFFFICIANAQNSNSNNFELKAFVGKEGLDTMAKEEFLKYGKVELNSEKLKVNSFTLSFIGGCIPTIRNCEGNSINQDWIKEIIAKSKKEILEVFIDEVSFYSLKGNLNQVPKGFIIVLK